MKTILDFRKMKVSDEKIGWITSYDYPTSLTSARAGIDMILIGDSSAMTVLGHKSTNPMDMNSMILLSQAVNRGAPDVFKVGDLPQGSYEGSNYDAIQNSLRFIKEANCQAVKLEGGKRIVDRVKSIVDSGILTVGHCALTPQSTETIGGYRVCCKTVESFDNTFEDALALKKAGICMLLLEGTPAAPAKQIAKSLDIPVLGIGCGPGLDGQLMIWHDLMGFYEPFRPLFAKCFIPEIIDDFRVVYQGQISNKNTNPKKFGRDTRMDGLLHLSELAIKKYIKDVKSREFPSSEYTYPLKNEELIELRKSQYWNSEFE